MLKGTMKEVKKKKKEKATLKKKNCRGATSGTFSELSATLEHSAMGSRQRGASIGLEEREKSCCFPFASLCFILFPLAFPLFPLTLLVAQPFLSHYYHPPSVSVPVL